MTATTPQAGSALRRPRHEQRDLFIDGGWRLAAGTDRIDVVGPSTGDSVTSVAAVEPSDVDVDDAVARLAFDEGPWGQRPPARTGADHAGIVWVNDWALLDPAIPFGGVKQSGYGREYGPEALDAYTPRIKSVVVSLA